MKQFTPRFCKGQRVDLAIRQQRHLLQVELVDRLIRELIARLEEQALYDASLIVVRVNDADAGKDENKNN